jgi:hypothetical protein
MNAQGLAATTSPAYWKAPEECRLVDISIAAAPTAVGAFATLTGAVYPGLTIRHANHLASLPNRIKLNARVPAGEQLGFTQF